MTEIPRTLKTFGGLPIQPAKPGDIVEGRPGTMVVRQAYADGSVRGNCEGREHVFDAGTFEVISKCLPDDRTYHECDNGGTGTAEEIATAIGSL